MNFIKAVLRHLLYIVSATLLISGVLYLFHMGANPISIFMLIVLLYLAIFLSFGILELVLTKRKLHRRAAADMERQTRSGLPSFLQVLHFGFS